MAQEPDVRGDLPHALFLLVVVFATYVATMPHTVTLEDSGGFILSSYFAGIAHPPGYPLHSLLGKVFTLLPLGTVALRVHLLSGLLGALSCVLLAWVVRLLGGTRAMAWCAALACAFSEVFWSQAIIAEVYTLHTCLVFLLLGLCLRFGSGGEPRDLLLAAFVYGLSLSNHWPLTVLVTPVFLVCVWSRRSSALRLLLPSLLCFLGGMTPFLYVWLRSLTHPEISFYGPIDSLDKFVYFVLRRNYSTEPGQATGTVGSQLPFLAFFAREALHQFTPAGAALAAVGCWAQWIRWPRRVALALTLGFLGTTAFLVAFLEFQDDFFHRAVARVFPMTSYCFMVGSSRVDLQACKLEYSIVSPK